VKLIINIFFLLIIPSVCSAGVVKQINFEWEYDVSTKDLAGYILYQNGQQLHIVNDAKALSVDLDVSINPGTTEVFTMKAFDITKNESALSAPYDLVVPSRVNGNNFLPIAIISHTQNDNELSLTAVGTKDFDGNIVKYDWDFGDGETYATLSDNPIKHPYDRVGEYIVTLKVTDNTGGIGSTVLLVSIQGLPTPQNFEVSI
jgi:PKD repeat protein